MKRLVCVLLATLLYQCTQAQDHLPAFGAIDKADLELNQCDFDPDTDVVYLMNIGETTIFNSIDVVTERRIRIKILKEGGMHEADLKLRYQSEASYEQITDIKGYTYNLDASGNIQTTPLDQAMIFDKKLDRYFSEVAFALPGVKPGSVVEFKYKTTVKSGYVGIRSWYFQKDQAVKYSSYHVVIPGSLAFTMQVVHRQDIATTKPSIKDEGYGYVMKNIPGLRNEPYQAGIKDYYQRVDFQLSGITETDGTKHNYVSTWKALTEKLLDDEFFGFQLRKQPIGSAEIKTVVAASKNEHEKTELIYKYVQKNMDWNGYNGYRSEDGIKKAWDLKSGNTGDINLILLSLLKDAGIKAYPCLVSTRKHGKVNVSYPFLEQFDGMYVYAIADNKPYIFNAADKSNPADLIPANVQFTDGFVVDNKSGGFISLSSYDHPYKQVISGHTQVDENGRFTGTENVSHFDYAKNNQIGNFTTAKLKEQLTAESANRVTIDSITTSDPEDAAPSLDAHIHFSGALQTSGGYSFLPYGLFSGFTKSPFVAEKRQTDVDFGYTQSYTISGGYSVSDAYKFEELPKNTTLMMPDTSIVVTRITQQQNNTVVFRIKVTCNRPQYSAEEYPVLRAFYQKMYALLNEQMVIKKSR